MELENGMVWNKTLVLKVGKLQFNPHFLNGRKLI